MFFLKKMFLGLGFVLLMFLGGAGRQSDNLGMQFMGFLGILLALVIIYFFWRMVWKGLGCLPSFCVLSAIVLFMMYALGMFNNGISGIGQNLIDFIGYESQVDPQQQQSAEDQENAEEQNIPEVELQNESSQRFSANFADVQSVEAEDQAEDVDTEDMTDVSGNLFDAKPVSAPQQAPKKVQKKSSEGLLSGLERRFAKVSAQAPQAKAFNPNDYPAVYASNVQIVSGDTLQMYGKTFRLFGVDAPVSNQTCADRQGRAYHCGREAASWLRGWIQDGELECHVLKQDTKGNMLGTCSFGPYDLGAALVNAGWAVANKQQTEIYTIYEQQAQEKRRGLWQGQFYAPRDWRKLQARKPKIKVLKPKERKLGIFG